MPYPREHMLLQWTGEFTIGENAGVADIFSGTMRFGSNGDVGGAVLAPYDTEEAMEDLIADLSAFWARPESFIPPSMVLRSVKWNRIGTDGRYASSTETRVREGLSVRGVRGVVGYPTFIAIASTYTTEARRGLASKGRTFWPTNIPVAAADFQVARPDAIAFGTSVAQLITDFGNWPGIDTTPLKPVVASHTRTGGMREITGVRVGRTLDTQRRRKNASPENYVELPLP